MRICNWFRQRGGEILCIVRIGGRRGATPTFATVFHFTAILLTETVFRIITQIPTYIRHLFVRHPYKWLNPQPQCKQENMDIYKFFSEKIILHCPTRILQHLKAHWAISVFFHTKCCLFHKFIPLSSRNIQVFRKSCTKFKYPAE